MRLYKKSIIGFSLHGNLNLASLQKSKQTCRCMRSIRNVGQCCSIGFRFSRILVFFFPKIRTKCGLTVVSQVKFTRKPSENLIIATTKVPKAKDVVHPKSSTGYRFEGSRAARGHLFGIRRLVLVSLPHFTSLVPQTANGGAGGPRIWLPSPSKISWFLLLSQPTKFKSRKN